MSSHRRLDAFAWKGPPVRIDAGGISDDELCPITALALGRLETARLEPKVARPRERESEKTL